MSQTTLAKAPRATRRGGHAPFTEEKAKEIIQTLKFKKEDLAKLFDITPEFYETSISTEVRKGLREQSTERVQKSDLLGTGGELLCSVGEYPFFWQYGAAEIERKTVRLRSALKDRFPELFPPRRLEYVAVNDEGDEIYYPNYYEVERVLIHIYKYEANRMHTTKALRSQASDQAFDPRFASATPRKSRSPTKRGTPAAKKKMLRTARLTINHDNTYTQLNFIDFYEDEALKRYDQTGRKDLDVEKFSILKLKTLAGKTCDLNSGYLRLEVDPPKEVYPEFLKLDGSFDTVTKGDEERLVEIMRQFKTDMDESNGQLFELEYYARE